jgi:hypothetical protein
MSEKCRSCRAQVTWAVTEKGKRTPIDFAPVASGNIFLRSLGPGRPPLAIYKSADEIAELKANNPLVKLFTSHFSTCPESKKWRKKKGGK